MSEANGKTLTWKDLLGTEGREIVIGKAQPIVLRQPNPIIWNDDGVSVDISGKNGRIVRVWKPQHGVNSPWIEVKVHLLGFLIVDAFVRPDQIILISPEC